MVKSTQLKLAALALGAGLTASAGADAALMYDQNVTNEVIFGSGNANGGFTVDQANGVEIGLRGKLRFNSSNLPENTFNSNGDGTYSFATGAPTGGAGWVNTLTTPIWNFEWSINSNFDGTSGFNLNGLTFRLGLDYDPGVGTAFLEFDLINDTTMGVFDHAFGTNVTGQGGGTETADAAEYSNLLDTSNLVQNSWNYEFFNNGAFAGFDPLADGQYNIYLTAFDPNGTALASSNIDIIVGAGATAVPEPSALALFGLGLAGLAGLGTARRRKTA